jgi:uncharacterized protein (TIGR02246 family)
MTDEEQIRTLVADWMAASRRGDTARVLELMDEDVVFLGAGRPPMRGKAAFAAASLGMSGMTIDGRSEIQEVQVSGDLAYCWNELNVTVTGPDGAVVRRVSGPALSVLRRTADGRWVIYRDANMLAPAAT